jgi:hypothetical protein
MTDLERYETLTEKHWKPELGFFVEPSTSRRTDYRPWETTPISEQKTEVQVHQRAVDTMTYGMLGGGSYPYKTQQLEDYVSLMYFSREANRKTKNTQSFNNSLTPQLSPDVSGRVTPMKLRMIDGRASPSEIREVRAARGMGSAELAKLTHIFGYRLENIDLMREDVLRDVEVQGGVIHENPTEEYAIIAADNSITHSHQLQFALTMVRIRHIATIGEAKDIERSSFIVLLNNQSRLDEELVKRLKSVKINGEPENENGDPSNWARQMMELGLTAEVKKHLDSNDFETIVPMSTTIFEYDPKVIAEVKALRNSEALLNTSDIIQQARQAYLKSVGGIALFGSHAPKK